MRNIFVIGLGNFGYHFARKVAGKTDVTAIDLDRDRVQRIGPLVARAVVGNATSKELLLELGIESADAAVVSMGQQMEASILATLHLKAFGVSEIYAKAISDDHAQVLEMVGATRVLHPEREVAENLAVSILEPSVTDYLKLHKHFGIIEVTAPEPFWGQSLMELGMRRRYKVTAIAIFREDDKLVNPAASSVIQRGDRLVLLGTESDILSFKDAMLT